MRSLAREYVCVRVCVYVHMCAYVCMCACVCVCVYMCMCVRMCMCACACVCVYVHVCACICVRVRACVYMFVCVHMHVCACVVRMLTECVGCGIGAQSVLFAKAMSELVREGFLLMFERFESYLIMAGLGYTIFLQIIWLNQGDVTGLILEAVYKVRNISVRDT